MDRADLSSREHVHDGEHAHDVAPANAPGDDADEPGSPAARRHSHKEKKHKKEKKKDKKEKEHRHKRDKHSKVKRDKHHRGEGEAAELAEEQEVGAAAAAAEPAVAEKAVAGPAVAEPAGAAAEQPLPSPANGAAAAEHPSPAAAGSAEHEEGELPETLPPSASEAFSPRSGPGQEDGAPEGDDRHRASRRSRSHSRSPARERHRDRDRERASGERERQERGGRADRERDRHEHERGAGRGRSPGRERSPRREGSQRPLAEERPGREDRRPRSRSLERRQEPDRSRYDDRARLPPRPLDRDRDRARMDVDRRRGPDDWRRAEEERRRGGGGGSRGERLRSLDSRGGRRSRSRSRERNGQRKRGRSGSREGRRRREEGGKEEEEEDVEEFQRRVAAALEGRDEDEDRLIEERRRRRQEILAKHREQQQLSESIAAPTATALRRDVSVNFQPEGGESTLPSAAPSAPASALPSPARQPAAGGSAGVATAETPEPAAVAAAAGGGMPPPSPEPGLSEEEDAEQQVAGEGDVMDIWKHDEEEHAATAGAGVSDTQASAGTKTGIGEDDGELAKRVGIRRNVDVDMFATEDDIFAATPPDVKGAAEGQPPAAGVAGAAAVAATRKGLLDSYDDHEGYYNFQVGELVAERFEVVVSLGKGVFSSVLKARDMSRKDLDTNQHPEVAIKVIRANETMYKAGQMEKVILRKLSEADKEGRRHCIRMLSSFEYRNHLCLVFESMDLNLRELTKRYGRGIGLAINAVRIYAQQMLVALHHLKNCGVLHADIKPDNILVNSRRTVVKLCDFGSAMFTGDNEITPYLVSRFYRPPEVILGLPYDHPMDMWSVGCVIYELFTGHILYPGKTNNEMLKLMMDVKGPFPKKMLKKAEFAFKHFENDPNMSFALLEEDPVTKRPVRRLIPNPAAKHDFAALLAGQSPDRRKLAQLSDLLERMTALDPDKRISPKDALRHPFIKEPPQAPALDAK